MGRRWKHGISDSYYKVKTFVSKIFLKKILLFIDGLHHVSVGLSWKILILLYLLIEEKPILVFPLQIHL